MVESSELIKLANDLGKYIANNSEQINNNNELQYYLCGSLATMLLANATEIEKCNIENNCVTSTSDKREVSPKAREMLSIFARQLGDIDVMNVSGNMMENAKREKNKNNIAVNQLNAKVIKKNLDGISDLFKIPILTLTAHDDMREGLSNDYGEYSVSKIRLKDNQCIYIASPESMLAQKLEQIINIRGHKMDDKPLLNESEYPKDIKDLVIMINGINQFYGQDEISKKVAEVVLNKQKDMHFKKFQEHLPKIFADINRDVHMVSDTDALKGKIEVENVSNVLNNIYLMGKEKLEHQEDKSVTRELIGDNGTESTFSSNEIGKATTIGTETNKKDKAMSRIEQDMRILENERNAKEEGEKV